MIPLVLPNHFNINGNDYPINTDYRDILEIISQLNDTSESNYVRTYLALALFYDDFDSMNESEHEEALNKLFWFIRCGVDEAEDIPSPKRIDWEQDMPLIVTDINKVSGCEIRALPELHWWTFMSWFESIGEGRLSTIVGMREKRRKGQKLEKWEQEFYYENRSLIEFKRKYTLEELEEKERINKLLGE